MPLTANDLFKVFSGTTWQLFSTVAPAISIGLVYDEITDGEIGKFALSLSFLILLISTPFLSFLQV